MISANKPKSAIVTGALCIIYSTTLLILLYYVVFVAMAGWRLTFISKIKVIWLLAEAICMLVGGIGVIKFRAWARKLVLIVSIITILPSFYELWRAAIDAIENISYDGTCGSSLWTSIGISYFIGSKLFFIYYFTKPSKN